MFHAYLRVSAVDQRELLLSEGTVILHITFALKQDQVHTVYMDSFTTLHYEHRSVNAHYATTECSKRFFSAGTGERVSEGFEGDPYPSLRLLPVPLHCGTCYVSRQDSSLRGRCEYNLTEICVSLSTWYIICRCLIASRVPF